MENIKEITVAFKDNGYYIVRAASEGDTICGTTAHAVMHALQKRFNYSPDVNLLDKVAFIVQFIQQ